MIVIVKETNQISISLMIDGRILAVSIFSATRKRTEKDVKINLSNTRRFPDQQPMSHWRSKWPISRAVESYFVVVVVFFDFQHCDIDCLAACRSVRAAKIACGQFHFQVLGSFVTKGRIVGTEQGRLLNTKKTHKKEQFSDICAR